MSNIRFLDPKLIFTLKYLNSRLYVKVKRAFEAILPFTNLTLPYLCKNSIDNQCKYYLIIMIKHFRFNMLWNIGL